jgi:catechol 2,3-dioxygenase-like lactoylglutathione lyase family enzyme
MDMMIEHFAFDVSDIDAAILFYVERLGFHIQSDKALDGKVHEVFAVLEMDGGNWN